MIGFIDEHREAYGVEPICKVLPIAPSTYHKQRRAAAGCYAPVGSGAGGPGSEARDRPCVRRELRGVRRAQGLAADDAGGFPSDRPLQPSSD